VRYFQSRFFYGKNQITKGGNKMAKEKPEISEDEDRGLNEKLAAKMLGFSYATMRTMRKNNGGPAYMQIGRNVRYMRSDVLKYIEEHKQNN